MALTSRTKAKSKTTKYLADRFAALYVYIHIYTCAQELKLQAVVFEVLALSQRAVKPSKTSVPSLAKHVCVALVIPNGFQRSSRWIKHHSRFKLIWICRCFKSIELYRCFRLNWILQMPQIQVESSFRSKLNQVSIQIQGNLNQQKPQLHFESVNGLPLIMMNLQFRIACQSFLDWRICMSEYLQVGPTKSGPTR